MLHSFIIYRIIIIYAMKKFHADPHEKGERMLQNCSPMQNNTIYSLSGILIDSLYRKPHGKIYDSTSACLAEYIAQHDRAKLTSLDILKW